MGPEIQADPTWSASRDPNADVAEVVRTGSQKRANQYLEHGYRLVGVYQEAVADTNRGQPYVRKGPEFVLARPREVEPFTPGNQAATGEAPEAKDADLSEVPF